MALPYAELAHQREQERAADPTWRGPSYYGRSPSRVPGASRTVMRPGSVDGIISDDRGSAAALVEAATQV